jgi:hypothetical protein
MVTFHTGSCEVVKVCHVRDPSSFYVHRVADCMSVEDLSVQLSKHVHAFSTPPKSVLKGKYKAVTLVHCDFHTVRIVRIH